MICNLFITHGVLGIYYLWAINERSWASYKQVNYLNTSRASSVHLQDPKFIITAAVDALAPNGAWSTTATMIEWDKFHWISVIPCYLFWPYDLMQNGR